MLNSIFTVKSDIGQTSWSILQDFKTKLISIINETNCDTLTTNGNIASVLTNFAHTSFLKQYPQNNLMMFIGVFNDVFIYVDALKRWDDNIIYFKCGEEIVYELIINDENSILI